MADIRDRMNGAMIMRVCIVEDDVVLCETLAETLNDDPATEVLGTYHSAEEFLERGVSMAPDLVIMDLNLPGMDGIACTRRIKEASPTTQVLVCTVQDDDDSLFNALCAGATGYLLKDAKPTAVLDALRSLHAGGSPMSPGIARRVLASFSAPPRQAKEMELLSERERQVLERLAKGHRYKEIAEGLHLSIETVRTHIRNLYAKLQVSSRTDALNKLFPR